MCKVIFSKFPPVRTTSILVFLFFLVVAGCGREQAPVPAPLAVSVSPANAATSVPVTVHSFPNRVKFTEMHVVKSQDSVSLKPLTLEEAVKEAEFRDREVFVFRDPQGRVKVLHRKKDGKMELIEAP